MCSKVELNDVVDLVHDFQKEKRFEPFSFSWSMVKDVCINAAGGDVPHENVVVACGEAFAFGYHPKHFAPMYMNLAKSMERTTMITGYDFSLVWTSDPEKAWQFVKKSVDAGQPVQIEGPEESLIYGYKSGGNPKDRTVYAMAEWGPGLKEDATWEDFSRHIKAWGTGLQAFKKKVKPRRPEEVIENVISTIVRWQENHPGEDRKIGEYVMEEETLRTKSFSPIHR